MESNQSEKKHKIERFEMRMDSSLKNSLSQIADSKGLSLASLITMFLKERLQQEESWAVQSKSSKDS